MADQQTAKTAKTVKKDRTLLVVWSIVLLTVLGAFGVYYYVKLETAYNHVPVETSHLKSPFEEADLPAQQKQSKSKARMIRKETY